MTAEGAAFGFSDRPVEELEADAIIDGYSELIPILDRLSRWLA